jgi:hypothetical protein
VHHTPGGKKCTAKADHGIDGLSLLQGKICKENNECEKSINQNHFHH